MAYKPKSLDDINSLYDTEVSATRAIEQARSKVVEDSPRIQIEAKREAEKQPQIIENSEIPDLSSAIDKFIQSFNQPEQVHKPAPKFRSNQRAGQVPVQRPPKPGVQAPRTGIQPVESQRTSAGTRKSGAGNERLFNGGFVEANAENGGPNYAQQKAAEEARRIAQQQAIRRKREEEKHNPGFRRPSGSGIDDLLSDYTKIMNDEDDSKSSRREKKRRQKSEERHTEEIIKRPQAAEQVETEEVAEEKDTASIILEQIFRDAMKEVSEEESRKSAMDSEFGGYFDGTDMESLPLSLKQMIYDETVRYNEISRETQAEYDRRKSEAFARSEAESELLRAEQSRIRAQQQRQMADEEAAAQRRAREEEYRRRQEEARIQAEIARRHEEERLARRRAEEERLAAEAEQARLAEEARIAAEAEQARLAEEARIAAEVEEARRAEEARIAAEAEEARLQAEAEEEARLQAEAEERLRQKKEEIIRTLSQQAMLRDEQPEETEEEESDEEDSEFEEIFGQSDEISVKEARRIAKMEKRAEKEAAKEAKKAAKEAKRANKAVESQEVTEDEEIAVSEEEIDETPVDQPEEEITEETIVVLSTGKKIAKAFLSLILVVLIVICGGLVSIDRVLKVNSGDKSLVGNSYFFTAGEDVYDTTIKKGDFVIVWPSDKAENGQTIAFVDQTQLTYGFGTKAGVSYLDGETIYSFTQGGYVSRDKVVGVVEKTIPGIGQYISTISGVLIYLEISIGLMAIALLLIILIVFRKKKNVVENTESIPEETAEESDKEETTEETKYVPASELVVEKPVAEEVKAAEPEKPALSTNFDFSSLNVFDKDYVKENEDNYPEENYEDNYDVDEEPVATEKEKHNDFDSLGDGAFTFEDVFSSDENSGSDDADVDFSPDFESIEKMEKTKRGNEGKHGRSKKDRKKNKNKNKQKKESRKSVENSSDEDFNIDDIYGEI